MEEAGSSRMPVDTGRKLNVHETFILHPVSMENANKYSILIWNDKFFAHRNKPIRKYFI